jgi:hypothetical protein
MILYYYLPVWDRVHGKPRVSHLVKNFPTFCETGMFTGEGLSQLNPVRIVILDSAALSIAEKAVV